MLMLMRRVRTCTGGGARKAASISDVDVSVFVYGVTCASVVQVGWVGHGGEVGGSAREISLCLSSAVIAATQPNVGFNSAIDIIRF